MHIRSLIVLFTLFSFQAITLAEVRIKDIVSFEGIRENVLVGYGIVVGLNGTGDNLKNSAFTEKGLSEFLEKMGVNTNGTSMKTKNVAAVMVTATLPPFARTGSKINLNVSTLGDAKSLQAGTLLATTLLGADGEVYAIAQGPVIIGAQSDATDKNARYNPTNGYINNGAIVEKEIAFSLNTMKELNIGLKAPDITTARSIATAINSTIASNCAKALDPGTVRLTTPELYSGDIIGLLADIENILITQESVAKVVIDSATGTIVMGDNVRIAPVALSHGNIVIQVTPEALFEYDMLGKKGPAPKPSAPGTKIATIKETATLSDLVSGLNALGLSPKDLIAILKTMKQAGALQAELEIR